jgi:hypothetical protein
MIELGRKSQIAGAEHWPTFGVYRDPRKMPKVPKGHTIACGIEQEGAEGERIFICETPEDMQMLYHEHVMGHTTRIRWYHTDALSATAATR